MARTTRSKASASTATTSDSKSTPSNNTKSKYTLPTESTNPPKLFILPTSATKDAKIVSLLNPRYAKPTRYLVCPETGIYEFTRIAAPKATPRSWLIECGNTGKVEEKTREDSEDSAELGAYITKGADLYVATLIDPMFLLLPAFADQSANTKDGKRMFVSSDDHLDSIRDKSPHLSEILRWGNVRTLLESRMAAICDTAEAGDETMFRFNEDKLLTEVLSKAQKMSEQPLPKSMEEKFVTKALEAPVVGVKRENTTTLSVSQTETQTQSETPASTSTASTPKPESVESQSSTTSTGTAPSLVSEVSTAATSVVEESVTTTTAELKPSLGASPEIIALQRLRTAFHFICSCYLAPPQAAQLQAKLTEQKPPPVDFAPLDDYLEEVSKLRQELAAARSVGDYSRKRVLDEEELADRAEKKRRKEEEEKRKKAGESKGVRDLKKVNTAGMKKMSDFFKKK
ncbi:ribonuclease H2, subunit B [Daldinia caldariorum]|uniref:ribonuclease H2, subunit B n=1 Tax=Daldinia caldariorum TaxID=326644 RepID=UPI0020082A83|nr:ribonuclease H2, subunit B [Daldinia caldariorum]KAI1473060.1 ribonuclease H2, subunit B [Daldinia caldariorum]